MNELSVAHAAIAAEVGRIQDRFGQQPFNSPHEFYAVLSEELDEFWDTVKANDPDPSELVQVAAVTFLGLQWLADPALDGFPQWRPAGGIHSPHDLYGQMMAYRDCWWGSLVGGVHGHEPLERLLVIAAMGIEYLQSEACTKRP